jgi:hypothetical protein
MILKEYCNNSSRHLITGSKTRTLQLHKQSCQKWRCGRWMKHSTGWSGMMIRQQQLRGKEKAWIATYGMLALLRWLFCLLQLSLNTVKPSSKTTSRWILIPASAMTPNIEVSLSNWDWKDYWESDNAIAQKLIIIFSTQWTSEFENE